MDTLIAKSKIASGYNKIVDNESAYEILNEKLNEAAKKDDEKKQRKKPEDKGFFDDPIVKSMTRTAGNTIVRSLLGVLGLGGRSSRRKSSF
ncbi:MAG TPA: helicase HerA-like domain-containing protein [Chitinophagaceae bacterium]|nr:helicase HerA-like domain-containing protein [Chitinophagaceae bacterium]